MKEARAFWITGRERGEIRSEALRDPQEGEVLVEALFSGVSRGTELLVYRGEVPESEWERMRAPHQEGQFPFPVKYGYSSVGRVVRGPAKLEGRLVFCLFPHQTAYVIGEAAVVPLPDGVSPKRAALAANCETALNAIWDADVAAGDCVTVVGAGTVGALVAHLAARHPGVQVELVDVDPRKSKVADALGTEFASPETARPGADIVVHASGAAAGLELSLSLAAFEATILELSWYGRRPVELSLGGAFHSQRLTLRSSQVGAVAPRRRARFTRRQRLELSLSLLMDERLEVLLGIESAFEDLPNTMRELSSRAGECPVVSYG